MKTVRIIVESPDTGVVAVDVTTTPAAAPGLMRSLGRSWPWMSIRKLGDEYAGCGNLVGRRVPVRVPA